MADTKELTQSSTSLIPTGGTLLDWLEDDFTRFELPQVEYEPSRWATARTKNVEEMAQTWSQTPNLAYVLNDSKLRGNELVLLRKELLDRLLTPLLELYRGRAAIRVDIDIVVANVEALKHSLNSLMSSLDPNSETATEAARAALATVKALEVQISKMSASVVVSRSKDTEMAPLSEEEAALAKELSEEEERDED